MGQHILHGNPPVTVNLRRSARARRISLRVSGLDGRVTLTLPKGVSEREAMAFAQEKADWLRGHVAKNPGEVAVGLGAVLPVAGHDRTIVAGNGRQVQLSEGAIMVPGASDRIGARLQGWLKAQARDRLAQASDHYATRLGRSYSGLTIRDTRSRWGSCSSRGGLMYSWRLIMAPPEVLDYVAAHEVAHLDQMNHSPAFWAVVQDLYGPYKEPRTWLRHNGSTLHRFRFTD